jgi:shikimate kinase
MSYIVIIRGPLGVGKSTVAKKLAEKLKGGYVSIDEVLAQNDLDHVDEIIGCISETNFLMANKMAGPKITKCLEHNRPVVIDGNFYHKSQITDLTNNSPYKAFVFTLTAPLEVCIERDAKREKSHGAGAACAVHNLVSKFSYGEIIDNSLLSEDETMEKIILRIIG